MISDWFGLRRGRQTPATLKAIYISTVAGDPMLPTDSVEAIENRGLQGDRYCSGCGHWQSIEACQVTLITEDDLRTAKHKTSADIETQLDHGGHRRNLIIDGLKVKQLEGRSFAIGSAVFRYAKPRPPCGYIDQVAGKGMGKALNHNSGICIRVVRGGRLSVGDSITLLDPV